MTLKTSFAELGLNDVLQQALIDINYSIMTPIQAQVIPLALAGRDILGTSQTGSGKTAAFAIPLIAKLMNSSKGSALILTPTRELAMQVMEVMQSLRGKDRPLRTALLIGGEPMRNQFNALRMNPRIIVGTPGRINDHLQRESLRLNDTEFLVLDEADRMLDMGFDVQLEEIASYLPKKLQTLMFSATFQRNILRLSEKYLHDPVRVAIDSEMAPVAKIKQTMTRTSETNKYAILLDELDSRTGSVLIFVKTKIGAEKLSKRLNKDNHVADTIHGDLRQRERTKVIKAFRDQAHRIMVATDVAARGLDIPHIEHVVNYDLPQSADDYIHRIGRTGRAGAEGSAITLLTPEDNKKWGAIERLINPNAPRRSSQGYRGAQAERRGAPVRRSSAPQNRASERNFSADRSARSERPAERRSSPKPTGSSERRFVTAAATKPLYFKKNKPAYRD